MKRYLCLLLCFSFILSLTACKKNTVTPTDTIPGCIDGCEIPEYDANGNQVYAIVSPVGYNEVEKVTQAPRLDSLAGKTIALVGGSFMAATTHQELKKCIQETYPTAKIYMFNEVGSGGPYSVYGQSTQTINFQNKLKELGVDAVISGNCGCGLCTTKESGSSIAAEYIGIPTVTIGAPTFIAQIHSTGVNRGIPVLRTAEYPGAFSSHSTDELVKNTREKVFPQVVTALTAAITQEEIDQYANQGKLPYDEVVYYGNYDEIQEYCKVNQWTDGLPVTPATNEKVLEYLAFTPYEAADILGTYALAYRECTAYTVAVNAVMAGVPKEFMPLCIAFVKCMADGEWRRPLASTHGWSPYAWLNGPVARQLGIDHGQGMISEENNKALGRFIDLAMLNIGGYYVKENRMGTFGYLSAWTFAEDEQACADIGWQPYHVTQGYNWNDNTITAGSALQWGNNVTPATDDPEIIMTLLAWDITEKQQNGLGNTNPQVYRTVFITEDVAKDLAKLYSDKGALEDALIETARRPLYMRAYANYWANTGSQQFDKYTFEEYYNKLLQDTNEQAGLTDTPPWLEGIVDKEQIETIATMLKGQTPLLITGDADRNKFQVMPGGGYVTVKIELPKNWNDLVVPLGYEPLETFYIDVNNTPEYTPPQPASGITAPAMLTDGTYRIVPSAQQLTEGGRVFKTADGQLQFWDAGVISTIALPNDDFGSLVKVLGYNCSFTISGGSVSAITIRPSTVAKKPSMDVSKLTASFLKNIPVTFAITTKQSLAAGGVTPAGTTVTLSATLNSITIDLGGQYQVGDNSTKGFVSISGNTLTFDPESKIGSSVQLGINLSGGIRRILIITKQTDSTYVFSYKE